MKMLPTPERRSEGSRRDHMILHGRSLMTSKFIVSRARSAVEEEGEEGLEPYQKVHKNLSAIASQ